MLLKQSSLCCYFRVFSAVTETRSTTVSPSLSCPLHTGINTSLQRPQANAAFGAATKLIRPSVYFGLLMLWLHKLYSRMNSMSMAIWLQTSSRPFLYHLPPSHVCKGTQLSFPSSKSILPGEDKAVHPHRQRSSTCECTSEFTNQLKPTSKTHEQQGVPVERTHESNSWTPRQTGQEKKNPHSTFAGKVARRRG